MTTDPTPPAGRDDLDIRIEMMAKRIAAGFEDKITAPYQEAWRFFARVLRTELAPSDLPGSPSDPAPVRWNVCPDCSGRHPGGAACPDVPDAPTPNDLQGSPTAGSTDDLRERIAEVIRTTVPLHQGGYKTADAVMAVVAPRLHTAECDEELDELATELLSERGAHQATINRVRAIHYPKTVTRIEPCDRHASVIAPPGRQCPDCREVPEQACANLTCCGWPCKTAAALDPPEETS